MKRTLVTTIAFALLVGLLPVQAQAWSLRTRHDPDDTADRTDIRRIRSDLTGSRLFIQIATWQRVRSRFIYYVVWLDTHGSRLDDRSIEITRNPRHLQCVVGRGLTGHLLGERRARRSSPRTVACVLPRSWFGRIQRAVRFYVVDGTSDFPDRAPDHGRYRWL